MTDLSDYSEDAFINTPLRATALTGGATVYLALMTANPTDAGGGTEAAFASYVRKSITFSAPSTQTITNSNSQTFAAVTVSPVTITALAIYDASTSGNLLGWKALSPTLAYAINDVPEFAAGGITFNIPDTAGLSDYVIDKMLNVIFRNQAHTGPATIYIGAHSAAPSGAGGGTEWSYSGYARQAIAFAAPSGGASSNSGAIAFPAVAGGSVNLNGLGVYDALTGGNLLNYEVLGATVSFATGNILRLAASSYVVTMA